MTEAAAQAGVQEDADRTLYWTLSLYIDAHNLPSDFAAVFAPANQMNVQREMFDSLRLRWAIEPMFNDIADREHLGVVEDYLLDVKGDHQGREVTFQIPPVVEWSTEGKTFAAEIGEQKPRNVRFRTFWYVHANGALSYHVSFSLNYQHSVADFYFLSLLQKAAAPKEFRHPEPFLLDKSVRQIRVQQDETGVFPLDQVKVQDGAATAAPFWHFIAARFNADAADLFETFPLVGARAVDNKRLRDLSGSYFDKLITLDDFIETPGLAMPRARFMFMFDDREFIGALLPRDDGQATSRMERVKAPDYIGYPEAIRKMAAAARAAGQDRVVLSAAFLNSIPLDRLRYLFLAGFNQNIIDFVNQEAHEVLDSLDPIYPATEEQEAESFFVRYANPRCFTTFVSKLRSLDLGNDYIGTCPYAFLIHVLAMHNEYIVRNYERTAARLVKDISPADQRREFAAAAEKFYAFHKKEYAAYYRYRATNVFRYDTEQVVFNALEERRGIHKRVGDVERTVENLEKFTGDLESRHRQSDATLFAWLAGVFAFCQVGFQLIEKLFDTQPAPFGGDGAAWSAWVFSASSLNWIVLLVATLAGFGAIGMFWRWMKRV